MKRTPAACLGLAFWVLALPAAALSPSELFEKVSPSVWYVRALDSNDRQVGIGSAVVIGPGRLVTNCHVLAKASSVLVRRKNVMYEAKLEHADAPRDLCVLHVEGFNAPAVEIAPAAERKVGQKVFAIGNPVGLELTLSEGLISGLRAEWTDGSPVIQTTAAASPGSSGGGLFDDNARLVGIITFGVVGGGAQNLNFALPSEWIAQVPDRAKAELARRDAPKTAAAPSAPPGYPAPGTVWVYRFTERAFGTRTADITVRADRVDPDLIEETVFAKGQSQGAVRRTVDTREARFLFYPIGGDVQVLEIAPYLLAPTEGKPPADPLAPVGYEAEKTTYGSTDWRIDVRPGDWEDVAVPAGKYRALRYTIEGERVGSGTRAFLRTMVRRFSVNVWYAPEVRRIVKLQHQMFDRAAIGDGSAELIEYRPPR